MIRFCLAGAATIALCAMAVSQKPASTGAATAKATQFAVLKGMPYSATQTTTITKVEPDGQTTTQTLISLLWRDAEGRTRQDDINENMMGETRAINVSDPIARVGYAWNDGDDLDKRANPVIVSYTPESWREIDTWPDSQSSAKPQNPPLGDRARHSDPNVTVEMLQHKILNGIYVEGQRVTRTIPAGAAGSGKSIIGTLEKWYSPELQLTIYSVQDCPRSGKTVVEVTNINRSNPDPSLFQPPANRPKIDMATGQPLN